MIDFGKNTDTISKVFSKKLINYNNSWRKIEQMQKKFFRKILEISLKIVLEKDGYIIGLSQIMLGLKKIQIKEVWVIMKYGIDIKNFINFQKIILF